MRGQASKIRMETDGRGYPTLTSGLHIYILYMMYIYIHIIHIYVHVYSHTFAHIQTHAFSTHRDKLFPFGRVASGSQ